MFIKYLLYIFKLLIINIVIFMIPFNLNAQSTGTPDTEIPGIAEPAGFRNIKLGMTVDQVKSILLEDPYFDYRGEPDVSFTPETTQVLIECEGYSYIKRAFFQFYEERLYILILILNEDKVDHYSLFTTLTDKYGNFTSLDPLKILWKFENINLYLEKPLSVKYVDMDVFNKITDLGKADENDRDVSRQQFLEQF